MSTLSFAGRQWLLKDSGAERRGPGNNLWSGSERNLWTDRRGLHLAIRRQGTAWTCAEVFSRETLGYGQYIFFVDARLDRLDPGAVLGLFTYMDDRNEIDVEIANFVERRRPPVMVNHVLQHPLRKEHVPFTQTGAFTTHRFTWKSTGVEWESYHGHHLCCPPGALIKRTSYAGPTPAPGGSRIHLNLWLHPNPGGTPGAPVDLREVEVVIRNVIHVEGDWGA